jgi:hypothetical protein
MGVFLGDLELRKEHGKGFGYAKIAGIRYI